MERHPLEMLCRSALDQSNVTHAKILSHQLGCPAWALARVDNALSGHLRAASSTCQVAQALPLTHEHDLRRDRR
jgi:hypothetical protein